jgi:hypothetical protein
MSSEAALIDPSSVDAGALYAQAVAALDAGDRAAARRLLGTVVWADPLHEAGWLLLSTVAEDIATSIQCLQRVLALNPENAQARQWLARAERAQARLAEAAQPSPPERAPDYEPLAPDDQPVPRLGRFLLDYQFVTARQLAVALDVQQAAAGQRPRLGDILLEQGAVSPDRLNFALREQQRMRAGLAGTQARYGPA